VTWLGWLGLCALLWVLQALPGSARAQPIEVHDVISLRPDLPLRPVALTFDACTGRFDQDLVQFLIRQRIPATLFVTRQWLDANPEGVALIKAHLDLFDVEDHGAQHIPAVIGQGRRVYGIPGHPDVVHLRSEVLDGAQAIARTFGVAPHWYRGATAIYDPQALQEIERLGFQVAGFSLNGDQGATLSQTSIAQRLQHVRAGDVVIAHMNKPASATAEGFMEGLRWLQTQGFVFVRLDQVGLQTVR
jgi:peptidoglycan/xylan/chitin deacetylase (PgdA/CDA1 family)